MLFACSLSLRRGLLHTVFCLPEGELFFSGASLFTVHSRFRLTVVLWRKLYIVFLLY